MSPNQLIKRIKHATGTGPRLKSLDLPVEETLEGLEFTEKAENQLNELSNGFDEQLGLIARAYAFVHGHELVMYEDVEDAYDALSRPLEAPQFTWKRLIYPLGFLLVGLFLQHSANQIAGGSFTVNVVYAFIALVGLTLIYLGAGEGH